MGCCKSPEKNEEARIRQGLRSLFQRANETTFHCFRQVCFFSEASTLTIVLTAWRLWHSATCFCIEDAMYRCSCFSGALQLVYATKTMCIANEYSLSIRSKQQCASRIKQYAQDERVNSIFPAVNSIFQAAITQLIQKAVNAFRCIIVWQFAHPVANKMPLSYGCRSDD